VVNTYYTRGEFNMLAANISIGRDMAGVHYYTDYYESLRMGERITTGILIEQLKHYNELVELSFESFDGDHVPILKNEYDYSEPLVIIVDSMDRDVDFEQWWCRHTGVDDHGETDASSHAIYYADNVTDQPVTRETEQTAATNSKTKA